MNLPLPDLRAPLLNAAGFLGFVPDPRGPIPLQMLGAFITNPISRGPRRPARAPLAQTGPGTALLHSGLPNPGLRAALKRYAAAWGRAPLPIIVHLLVESPAEAESLTRALEGRENILAVELGLPEDLEERVAGQFITAALGELPVIARISPAAQNLAPALVAAGSSAISLGPLPGAALSGNAPQRGRLIGPGLFPATLAATTRLAGLGVPLIASGGVYQPQQVQTLLAAGAQAVQLDGLLWRGLGPEWQAAPAT